MKRFVVIGGYPPSRGGGRGDMKKYKINITITTPNDFHDVATLIETSTQPGDSDHAMIMMLATEYMMYTFATRISKAGLEKALELLQKGALKHVHDYKHEG